MSTETGDAAVANEAIRDMHRQLDVARRDEEQLNLLDPVSAEEMEEARERLGRRAGNLSLLRDARLHRKGRKPGSQNKHTQEFRRWILSYGEHPAIGMMRLANTQPELLVERSAAMDPPKKRLSYGDAVALSQRAREGIMPFIEGKQPVRVEISAEGDFNLLIPGVNISAGDARAAADGSFVLEADYVDIDDETEGAGE